MGLRIDLKDITLEIDDELIERAKAYGIDEEEIMQMFLRSLTFPIREAVRRREKKFCPKCGKLWPNQMTRHEVMGLNLSKGKKKPSDFGYCGCDEK